MPLFQNSVVTKYLNAQDKSAILEQWNVYKNHFLNSTIQENIRNSKEEQYQGEFLIDLFVNVLGYTKNPTPNFNLTTELKNEKDSKKADGGILVPMGHDPLEKKVIGVIELKGTNTTDLNKIEVQAFGYKNNQKDCVYVITSNFEKLRFYIDNAIEHIEFNLFQLTQKEFELLYLCLAYTNISAHIPKKLKEESLSQEDKITKELYKDYSLFKNNLFHNLTALNPNYEPLELFKKSQKLLDRFLFLFFAEDRQLLPPNSVRLILDDWKDLKERDAYIPLYDRYKKYFEYLNTGFKGKRYDVFAYNGGLFKDDEILNNIKIDDDLLYKHTLKISEYDFESEVDVNILGHIFENSLNELDEMKSQLSFSMGHDPLEKQISKRKKDGVFYTPKYITKYIVENTVGKLCTEKKLELEINEDDYDSKGLKPLANGLKPLAKGLKPLAKGLKPLANGIKPLANGLKPLAKKTKQSLLDKITQYKNWLLQITIIDPACGSGAFLNEALNFLIAEHTYIDELQAKLFGDGLILSDVEKSILENNLFGVDLNEESVEIAKLSLWLRTAQPNRKLNDLNSNIKCGNSLIDDPEIAGEKAFNWQKEFPQIFKEKNKKAFHFVFTTHNSRVSQRMINLNIKKGPAIELNLQEEIELTKIFKEIILDNGYKCLAYNICKDHIHIILVCEEEEVTPIAQKLKSISSKLFHRLEIPMSHDPLEHKNHLWSQKFFFANLNELIWGDISPKPGYVATDTYLENALSYIKTNREKHNLPDSKELKNIIKELVVDIETAFKTEYKGGFDVVIGNPPYVRQELLSKTDKEYFVKKYKTGNGTADLYVYFYETALTILKQNGLLGFITPNKFYKTKYGKELRQFLMKYKIIELIDFFELKVFEDASTDSQILILEKNKIISPFNYSPIKNIINFRNNNYSKLEIEPNNLSDEIWVFNNSNDLSILNKMNKNSISLKNYTENGIEYGIKTGLNEAFIIDEETKNKIISEDPKSAELIKPYVTATDIDRFFLKNSNQLYFINTYYDLDISYYKGVFSWLLNFDDKLQKRQDKGLHHYNLRACKYYEKFEQPKIIYIHTAVNHKFYYDEEGYYINNSCYLISNADKFLSVWLNSKIFSFYKKLNFVAYGDSSESGRAKLDYNKMVNVPIPNINTEQKQPFIVKADKMLELSKELQLLAQKFQRTIQRKFLHPMGHDPLEIELPKKLQDWYLLSYGDFIKELAKLKIKLTLSQEAEWEDYFTQEAAKVLVLKNEIDITDKAIDKMVYELYDLSPEEIEIVEKS